MLAAAPAWFADNVTAIALGTLAVITFLVVRSMHRGLARVTVVAVVAGLATFVYLNRLELERCARTCECTLLDQQIDVPFCASELTEA